MQMLTESGTSKNLLMILKKKKYSQNKTPEDGLDPENDQTVRKEDERYKHELAWMVLTLKSQHKVRVQIQL